MAKAKVVAVPEAKSVAVPETRSIANKMVATEHGLAGHGTSKTAHVPAEMAPAKMAAAEMAAAKAATTVAAAMHGGGTQSRAGRDNRHGGQRYRYLPHHDVLSTSCPYAPQPLRRSKVAAELERAPPWRDAPAPQSAPQRSK